MRSTLCPNARFLLAVCAVTGSAAIADDTPVSIYMVGDSHLTSYRVPVSQSFDVQLQASLNAKGLATKVIDEGYKNGTEDGVAWMKVSKHVKDMFASPANNAVVLELGSNDCGDPELDQTRANLDWILARFAEHHIPVLVVGTHSYTICEHFSRPTYPTEYFQMFADLAAKYGDLYYPDFKEGVIDNQDFINAIPSDPELVQPDTDHLTAKGDAIAVAGMLPLVVELVARARQP